MGAVEMMKLRRSILERLCGAALNGVTVLILALALSNLDGCAAPHQVVRVEITEWSNGNLDDLPYPPSDLRTSSVVGPEAAEVAAQFPELGTGAKMSRSHAGAPRFELSFIRSDGAEERAEVLADQQTWFQDGNYYSVRPSAIDVLERFIRRAQQNPLVSVELVQFQDEDGRRYQAPKRYVVEDNLRAIADLFPEHGPAGTESDNEDVNTTILVLFRYANGDHSKVEVGKEKYARVEEDGFRHVRAVSRTARQELLQRLAMVGNTAVGTSGPAAASTVGDRLRLRREAEARQTSTSPAPSPPNEKANSR
jgi:hypothetical protein